MTSTAKRPRRWHPLWLWLALPPLMSALCRGGEEFGRGVPVALADQDAAVVALLFGGRLDPNRAAAHELALLPSIGPARASAIVEHAQARRFDQIGDLERVGGIGPKTVEKLAPWLVIEPAVADSHSTAQSPPGTPSALPGNAIGGKELSAHGRTRRRTR